jgi:hypothetical protein
LASASVMAKELAAAMAAAIGASCRNVFISGL